MIFNHYYKCTYEILNSKCNYAAKFYKCQSSTSLLFDIKLHKNLKTNLIPLEAEIRLGHLKFLVSFISIQVYIHSFQ